ncbi:MAG: GTP-binding protein [Promethearchaeota archaeon]|nr:MAG: GTP-binding protein [Candidatus Lokiarchaeota archaeon]
MAKKDIWAFKVILIGPAACGKTSILSRFVHNKFTESYEYTMGVDYLSKEVEFSNNLARLTIYDIGGQERFRFLRNTFYKGANGALLIFDLSRAQSYEEMKDWIYELKQLTHENIPFVLVGNKLDLVEDVGRFIDKVDIKKFAKAEGSIYIETSAKTGENIEGAFIELCLRMAKLKETIDEIPEDLEVLPNNAIEAQGLLIKEVYNRFGKEALPIISKVLRQQGRAIGLKVKNKLADHSLTSVAETFISNWDPTMIEAVEISDNTFHIKGFGCPFGLENTSRELCEAVMEIDHEYFRTAVSDKIELAIEKSVAAGDSCCDTIYRLKEKE